MNMIEWLFFLALISEKSGTLSTEPESGVHGTLLLFYSSYLFDVPS